MATTKKGTTILSLEVENFQGLKAAKLQRLPAAGLVKVTGKNGAGKSSLLKAISGALGGAAEVHERAIRDGSDNGASVALELSNGFNIRKRHTEANPKGHLVVAGPDGGKYGQAKLNDLLGPLSFDPQAFFQLPPKRQREILLSLGRDPELALKLEGLRTHRAKLYEERTPWISQQRRARQVSKPAGERPEPIDTSAEMERLRELQATQRDRDDAWRERDRHGETWKAQQRLVEQAEAAIVTRQDRIAELEQRLEAERRGLQGDRELLAEREHARDVAERQIEAAEVAAEALPDVSDDIQACMGRISQAEAVQRALKPWDAFDAAQKELEEASAAVDRITFAMTDLEATEHRLIAEAGIPVPSLSFDEDGSPLLNSRPLELASGGEKIELAVNVALAVDPELRICLVDEANDLDLEALERLEQLAVEHGFQVWCCRIGLEGPGTVTVTDGEAVTAGGVPDVDEAPEPVAAQSDLEF